MHTLSIGYAILAVVLTTIFFLLCGVGGLMSCLIGIARDGVSYLRSLALAGTMLLILFVAVVMIGLGANAVKILSG